MVADVVAVEVNHLARSQPGGRMGQQVAEAIVRLQQVKAEGVAINELDAGNVCIVVEAAVLWRPGQVVQARELVAKQELVGRVLRRVHETA